MVRTDRDALVCDLAETYGVLDYRALPAKLLATLAAGLREDSRIRMAMAGRTIPSRDVLLAAAVDRLTNVAWLLGGVCPARPDPPRSVLKAMLGREASPADEKVGFSTPEEYETEWRRRTGVTHGTK